MFKQKNHDIVSDSGPLGLALCTPALAPSLVVVIFLFFHFSSLSLLLHLLLRLWNLFRSWFIGNGLCLDVWVVLIKTRGPLQARHAKLGAILARVLVTPPGTILALDCCGLEQQSPTLTLESPGGFGFYHMSGIGCREHAPVSQVEIGSLSISDNGDWEMAHIRRGCCCHLGIPSVWLAPLPSWILFPSTCDCIHATRLAESETLSAGTSPPTAAGI